MNQEQKISPSELPTPLQSPCRARNKCRQKKGLNLYQNRREGLKASSGPNKFVNIHPEGKITDVCYKWRAVTDIFGYIKDLDILPENRELLSRFIMDAKLGKTIRKGAKKKVAELRLVKYLQDLRKLDDYFHKPLDKITQPEMEQFILALEEGRLKKHNGKPYALETQVTLKKIIIKFYRWLLGGCRITPPIVDWIDTSFELKEYHAVSKVQIENIVNRATSNTSENVIRLRAILMFLFDSGARADEALNIRLHHLIKENDGYKVRIEFSKTTKRTITLPLCKKQLDDWLTIHPAKDEPLAQLFPLAYHALCNVVKRAGKSANVKITPHSLRHSAATYWAKHLSRFQLCYRMGWAMSSKQPDRYIDREGIGQEEVAQVVTNDNMQKLSDENKMLQQRLAIMEEQINRLFAQDKEELIRIIQKVRQQSSGK